MVSKNLMGPQKSQFEMPARMNILFSYTVLYVTWEPNNIIKPLGIQVRSSESISLENQPKMMINAAHPHSHSHASAGIEFQALKIQN